MKLDIYSHLSDDYLQKFPRVTFDKGEIIVPAEAVEIISIYYILEGEVIVYSHAFRNALIPVSTVVVGTVFSLFAGSTITETIFAWNGIGKVLISAIRSSSGLF